jgi:hypothetical protein
LVKGRFGDQGYISSPHFPTVYPQDYSSQVQLKNIEAIEKQQSDNSSSTGLIQITFEDFALGPSSFIDVMILRNLKFISPSLHSICAFRSETTTT